MPVSVHVHEPQARVAPPSVNDRCALGKSEGQLVPALPLFVPGEDRILFVVGDDQLAGGIVVQVAEAHAVIEALLRSEDFVKARQQLRRRGPLASIKLPGTGGLLVLHQGEGVAIGLNNPKSKAFPDLRWKLARNPLALLRRPDSRLPHLAISDDHVRVAVVVQIHQANAVILAVRPPQRLSVQDILLDPLQRLAEIEKLNPFAVLALGVADEIDVLLWAAPAVGVEDKGHRSLLGDRGIKGGLPVFQKSRVSGFLNIFALPVAGHHAGEFPAKISEDVGVGIVFDVIGKGLEGHVPPEALGAVGIQYQLPRQRRVVSGDDVEDRGINRQEVPPGGLAVEDLRIEPRAGRVLRIAARHSEGDGMVVRHPKKLVDAIVKSGFRLGEISVCQQRAGVVDGVRLEADALREELLQLRIVGLDLACHDAEVCFAVDLLETVQDRPQKLLVFLRVAHVVDRQHDHRVNALLAHPLGRHQPGGCPGDVIGIQLVEVSQPIRVRSPGRRAREGQERDDARQEPPSTRHGLPARVPRGRKREAGANVREPIFTAGIIFRLGMKCLREGSRCSLIPLVAGHAASLETALKPVPRG